MESKGIYVFHIMHIYIHSYVTNAMDPQFSQSNRRMLNKSQKYTFVQFNNIINILHQYSNVTPNSLHTKNIRVMSPL